MKKLFNLLMVAILALGLVGCAKDEELKPAEITVQAESGWVEFYQTVADKVMADNPGTTITIVEMGSFDMIDLITNTDADNEDVADVFAVPADRMYGFGENDVLAYLPADEMAKEAGGFGDYEAGMGGLLKYDGEYLLFPMNIETLITFTNEANAAANGIDLTKSIEMTEVSANDVLIPVFNAWFGVALTNSADIELLGKAEDGTLFSDLTKDFSELTEDQQELFTALFNYYKAHEEIGSPVFTDDVWGHMDTEFKTGGANSARIEGPWSTSGLSEHAGEDMGILPLGSITINGNELSHWQGGWGFGVNARIEEDEAKFALAQKFIVEIMNPDYAVDWFNAAGKIMPNAQDSAYDSLEGTDKAVVLAVKESFENAPKRPLFKEWGQVWGAWENSIKSWPSVKPATVEEAYNEVKASFEAMMAQLNQ